MDELEAPLMMMRFIGPMIGAISVLMTVMLFAPVILYVIARWRTNKEPAPDGQLGLKFVLHYFAAAALQLALIGGTALLFALIGPGGEKGPIYRIAFGAIVPAGLILAAHLALLRKTDDAARPSVRRLFLGYNLIIVGIVAFGAFAMGFQLLFARGSSNGAGHALGSAIIVYGGAWFAIGYKFSQLVLGSNGGFGGFGGFRAAPQNVVTPGPVAVTTTTQPGLPPLGGGSYPPIDPPTP